MFRRHALVLAPLLFSGCNCGETLTRLNAFIEVQPESVDFGRVALGTAVEKTVTLRNKGSIVLMIEGFEADAPFVAPVETSSIGIGQEIEVTVGFRPTALGPQSGTLYIASTDPDVPVVEVPLAGEGIEAAVVVDPLTVDFGEVLWVANTPTQVMQVSVSNPGSDSFDLTSISLTEDAGGVFALDPMEVEGTYAPGDTKTFQVTYVPAGRGESRGSILIENTTRAAPEITVALTGKAVGPQIDLCAAADGMTELCTTDGEVPKVDFGWIPRMSTADGHIRVLNSGDRDLTLFSYAVAGQAPELSFSPDPATVSDVVIPPGEEMQVDVTYTPQDYVFDSIIVVFASDSPPGSVGSARVEGAVSRAKIDAVPRTITMSLNQGTMTQLDVRLFNCGQEPLTLSADVAINNTVGPTPAFSLQNAPTAGTTLAPVDCEAQNPTPGATFTVVFQTTMSGFYEAEVPLSSNDPVDPTITVHVEGSKT